MRGKPTMQKNKEEEIKMINLAAEAGSMIDELEECLVHFQSGHKKQALHGLDKVEEELSTTSREMPNLPEDKVEEVEKDIEEAHNHILWVINQMKKSKNSD